MKRVIFFDLGSTLVHNNEPWEGIFCAGDAALAETLQEYGLTINGERFLQDYGTFIDQYYSQLDPQDTKETTAIAALEKMLVQQGVAHIEPTVLRASLDAMYRVINNNWVPEKDAIPTLMTLQAKGYRLGLISNTSDDKHVQTIIDDNGFRTYFEFVITSAAFGYRKPDRRIFEAGLTFFSVTPEDAVMVGDNIAADIYGANDVGIYSIWLTRRTTSTETDIHPNASISTLSELHDLLRNIEQDN